MVKNAIRRTISALLMTSILSSSFSPSFAMHNGNNDDDDNDATVVAQAKQTVSNAAAVSQEKQATSSSTALTSTTPHPFSPLFAFDPHQMTPFWNSLYEALSPLERNNLEAASKLTQRARRIYDRHQVERIRLCDLYRIPSPAKRFSGLIVDDITHSYNEKNIVDNEGNVTRIPNFLDESSKIGVGDNSRLDLSKLRYLDATVKDIATLSTVLKNVKKAAVHLSLNETITGDILTQLEKIFPLNYAFPENSQTDKKMMTSPLMKLNSLRVIVDNAQTAISFLTWWSTHFKMGDKSNLTARPHLQMFINQVVREIKLIGEIDALTERTVEVGRIQDPRKIKSALTSPERDQFEQFENDFTDYGDFLRPYHEANNEEDTLGNSLRNEPLFRVISLSDLLDGVALDSRPNAINGNLVSSTMKNNLPSMMRLFKAGDSFEQRKHMEKHSTAQPTTLLEVLTVAEPLIESLTKREDKDIVLGSLIRLHRYYLKSAVKSLLNLKVEDDEVMRISLHFYHLFNKEDHDELTSLFSNHLPEWIAIEKSSPGHDPQYPQAPATVRGLPAVLKNIPRSQRLGALKSAFSFMTSQWVDLKTITSDESDSVLKAYGSLANDYARAEFDEFLAVNLPLNPDMNVYEYISIAATIPSDQRAEVTPLVSLALKGVKLNLSVRNIGSVTKLICDQSTNVRAAFCQNLNAVLTPFNSGVQELDIVLRLSAVAKSEQADVLQKTVDLLGGTGRLSYGSTNPLASCIDLLAAYNRQDRSEICSLVKEFTPQTQDRVRVLGFIQNVPLQEVKDLFTLLAPLSNDSDDSDRGGPRSQSLSALLDIPAQYRPLVVEICGIKDHGNEFRYYNRLQHAETIHQGMTTHLAKHSFAVQENIVRELLPFLTTITGFSKIIDGGLFAKFGALEADEDPIEIAKAMSLLDSDFDQVIKLPKGQRMALARDIAALPQQLTHEPEYPIHVSDVFKGLKGADPARIPSLLKQGSMIMRGHPISGYFVGEILIKLGSVHLCKN